MHIKSPSLWEGFRMGFFLLTTFIFSACETEFDPGIAYVPRIAVEGYIEGGERSTSLILYVGFSELNRIVNIVISLYYVCCR